MAGKRRVKQPQAERGIALDLAEQEGETRLVFTMHNPFMVEVEGEICPRLSLTEEQIADLAEELVFLCCELNLVPPLFCGPDGEERLEAAVEANLENRIAELERFVDGLERRGWKRER